MKDYKFTLILLVLAVSVIGVIYGGVVQMQSISPDRSWAWIRSAAMVVISLIDYKWILNFYWLMYVVNIALLLAVIFLGTEANGATRWLDLGFVQFSALSDLTKLITILFFCQIFWLTGKNRSIKKKDDSGSNRSDHTIFAPCI